MQARSMWCRFTPPAACLAWFALLAPLPLHGQAATRPARGAIELAVDLGHTRFASAVARRDGSRLGLLFARHLSPRGAWTFDITCTGGIPAGQGEDESFTICTGSLGARFDVATMRRTRPYVRAAYGQAQLDALAELDVFDIDDRGGATTVALGGRGALAHGGRIGWRAELAFVRHDLLGGLATHRSLAVGVSWHAP